MEAFAQFVPLILIFAIMYFLLIRPQQRKLKDHKKMVESLRRGDMIVTQGGLIGKVTKVKEDNELEVELSEGVKVRVVQSTVAQVLSKTEPAALKSQLTAFAFLFTFRPKPRDRCGCKVIGYEETKEEGSETSSLWRLKTCER